MNDERVQIALHAPNLINICVDNIEGMVSGRLYHCYSETPWEFQNTVQMVELMEKFYNSINYPQASTEARKFVDERQTSIELKKVTEQKDIIQYRGEKGTFLVHVQYRQNSSWQGQVEWVEKGVVKNFGSALDYMKLITAALE